jgi:hypothetical protein
MSSTEPSRRSSFPSFPPPAAAVIQSRRAGDSPSNSTWVTETLNPKVEFAPESVGKRVTLSPTRVAEFFMATSACALIGQPLAAVVKRGAWLT